jgi:hypothetical protein
LSPLNVGLRRCSSSASITASARRPKRKDLCSSAEKSVRWPPRSQQYRASDEQQRDASACDSCGEEHRAGHPRRSCRNFASAPHRPQLPRDCVIPRH